MDLILWDICAFYRENEEPNQQIANTLLKEIQEVEQIKNDATSTERRVLGKLLLQLHVLQNIVNNLHTST